MSLTLSGNSPKITADSTGVITSGTAVTASGTSVDFTGIPSWVKRITVMFNGVSTSGTGATLVQFGTSGGVVSSGYLSTQTSGGGTSTAATNGFICGGNAAADIRSGIATFTLLNSATNTWVHAGTMKPSSSSNYQFAGDASFAGVVTTVRVTTVNGTDTFDAGTINIMYE